MFTTYFKHEFNLMLRSKKNAIFIFFLAVILVSYTFLLLPTKKAIDTYDPETVQIDLDDVAVTQHNREVRGATGIILFNRFPAYNYYSNYYDFHKRTLTAFQDGDYRRFLNLRLYGLSTGYGDFITDHAELMYATSTYPRKDQQHLFKQTYDRYLSLSNSNLTITYNLIQEKTALQQTKQFLLSPLVYLLFFAAIYFGSDVLLRDVQNRSILQGLPISWYGLLNSKSIVAFLYSMLVLSVLAISGILLLTLKYGFGYFNLEIPIVTGHENPIEVIYGSMTMGDFLLKSLSFIPLIVYLFTRMNIVLSLLLKNIWLVILVNSIILFSERLYFSRTTREVFGYEISYFPQTYFDFGNVITGQKNYLIYLETISYSRGLLVIAITILAVEVLLFVVSRFVTKRRFYK